MPTADDFPYRRDVHDKLITAARAGRLLTYHEVHSSRGWVGKFLTRIAREEARAGNPPLTAIVVSKTTGRPGPGFLPVMQEIGYARPGETEAEVWERAVAEVHGYWRQT